MDTMIVTGVDFVSVPTQDLERAVTFYGETLGLPCSVHRPDFNFAEFETGTVTLALLNCAALGIEFQASSSPIEFRVDDVEAARAELESRGVQFKGEIVDSGVCHQTFFEDPAGNTLALHHRYAPRGG